MKKIIIMAMTFLALPYGLKSQPSSNPIVFPIEENSSMEGVLEDSLTVKRGFLKISKSNQTFSGSPSLIPIPVSDTDLYIRPNELPKNSLSLEICNTRAPKDCVQLNAESASSNCPLKDINFDVLINSLHSKPHRPLSTATDPIVKCFGEKLYQKSLNGTFSNPLEFKNPWSLKSIALNPPLTDEKIIDDFTLHYYHNKGANNSLIPLASVELRLGAFKKITYADIYCLKKNKCDENPSPIPIPLLFSTKDTITQNEKTPENICSYSPESVKNKCTTPIEKFDYSMCTWVDVMSSNVNSTSCTDKSSLCTGFAQCGSELKQITCTYKKPLASETCKINTKINTDTSDSISWSECHE